MVRVDEIYQRLPVPLQHLAVSLKGMELKYRRGSPALMDEEFERLRLSERWSAEKFLEYQRQQIVQLVRQAYEQVPYYRESWRKLGAVPSDIKTIDDFRKLPELKKEVVRNSPLRLVNEGIPRHRLRKGHTSGSTGKPLHYYTTREAFSRKWAFVSRLRYWAGISDPHFPRRAQFTGRDVFGASAKQPYRINLPGNALVLSTTQISERTVRSYLDAIFAWDPVLIDGYPSALLILVRLAKEKGLEIPRIPVIITTAETLDDETRAELAEAFRGSVYNQYSASEPSCFWSDCEAENMHIHPESGYSEIVRDDGSPVEPGEEGRILMTTFLNPAMPLIRYDIGDRAILASNDPCPCGRQMPRVERVVGRNEDIIYIPGRGYIGRLDPVLKGLSGIIESQIVQEELDRLLVRIVPASDFRQEVLDLLEANMRKKVGEQVQIRFDVVSSIPRGANGKLRAVVSLVRDQYPTRF